MTRIRSVPSVKLTATRLTSTFWLLIVIGAGLLVSACGSDGSDSNSSSLTSDGSDSTSSSLTGGTPDPSIEGPIDGTPILLGTTTFSLADVGYQQSEYFISGQARSFTETAPLQSDGKWSVRVADEA